MSRFNGPWEGDRLLPRIQEKGALQLPAVELQPAYAKRVGAPEGSDLLRPGRAHHPKLAWDREVEAGLGADVVEGDVREDSAEPGPAFAPVVEEARLRDQPLRARAGVAQFAPAASGVRCPMSVAKSQWSTSTLPERWRVVHKVRRPTVAATLHPPTPPPILTLGRWTGPTAVTFVFP